MTPAKKKKTDSSLSSVADNLDKDKLASQWNDLKGSMVVAASVIEHQATHFSHEGEWSIGSNDQPPWPIIGGVADGIVLTAGSDKLPLQEDIERVAVQDDAPLPGGPGSV